VPIKAGFRRFDRIELVVNRGGGAGQMPNAIHLKLDRLGDVVADQLKAWVTNPAIDVALYDR